MAAVLSNPRQQLFRCRDLISLQPDSLWVNEHGVVCTVTWTEVGNPITLGYWGPGDVIGQTLSRISLYQMECLTYIEASLIQLYDLALDALLLHAQQTEELLNSMRQGRIYHHLQQLLSWLAQKFGRPVSQGSLIDAPLTHQDIAEVIGTCRVTVTRLLEMFEQEELLGGTFHWLACSDIPS